jgi:hypothetical protein
MLIHPNGYKLHNFNAAPYRKARREDNPKRVGHNQVWPKTHFAGEHTMVKALHKNNVHHRKKLANQFAPQRLRASIYGLLQL